MTIIRRFRLKTRQMVRAGLVALFVCTLVTSCKFFETSTPFGGDILQQQNPNLPNFNGKIDTVDLAVLANDNILDTQMNGFGAVSDTTDSALSSVLKNTPPTAGSWHGERLFAFSRFAGLNQIDGSVASHLKTTGKQSVTFTATLGFNAASRGYHLTRGSYVEIGQCSDKPVNALDTLKLRPLMTTPGDRSTTFNVDLSTYFKGRQTDAAGTTHKDTIVEYAFLDTGMYVRRDSSIVDSTLISDTIRYGDTVWSFPDSFFLIGPNNQPIKYDTAYLVTPYIGHDSVYVNDTLANAIYGTRTKDSSTLVTGDTVYIVRSRLDSALNRSFRDSTMTTIFDTIISRSLYTFKTKAYDTTIIKGDTTIDSSLFKYQTDTIFELEKIKHRTGMRIFKGGSRLQIDSSFYQARRDTSISGYDTSTTSYYGSIYSLKVDSLLNSKGNWKFIRKSSDSLSSTSLYPTHSIDTVKSVMTYIDTVKGYTVYNKLVFNGDTSARYRHWTTLAGSDTISVIKTMKVIVVAKDTAKTVDDTIDFYSRVVSSADSSFICYNSPFLKLHFVTKDSLTATDSTVFDTVCYPERNRTKVFYSDAFKSSIVGKPVSTAGGYIARFEIDLTDLHNVIYNGVDTLKNPLWARMSLPADSVFTCADTSDTSLRFCYTLSQNANPGFDSLRMLSASHDLRRIRANRNGSTYGDDSSTIEFSGQIAALMARNKGKLPDRTYLYLWLSDSPGTSLQYLSIIRWTDMISRSFKLQFIFTDPRS